MVTLTDAWNEAVTAGLLGTDRRDPPELPTGAVADVVADALGATPAERLLATVAALTAATRAGISPAPPCATLQPPDADHRPALPAAAARRWHGIVAHWPLLEPEFLAVATDAGWRPSPDVLVAMLGRARRSPFRRRAVLAFGGAVAHWLVDHLAELGAAGSGRPTRRDAAEDEPTAELAVPAELRAAFELPPGELAAVIVAGLHEGVFRWAHRSVLLNAVAAMPAAALPAVIAALTDGRTEQERRTAAGHDPAVPLGLWESLLELATVRQAMLEELERN